jgi:hypothetical protein
LVLRRGVRCFIADVFDRLPLLFISEFLGAGTQQKEGMILDE